MMSYTLQPAPGQTLYEALYAQIRDGILSGGLAAGEELPSKRALAAHLGVSKMTVEHAYDQLVAEGYLTSRPRRGYYVNVLERAPAPQSRPVPPPAEPPAPRWEIDLTRSAADPSRFPFATWSRLLRREMATHEAELLQPLPLGGVPALRQAIAEHLYRFRALQVSPEQVVIGAGTEYLYHLLILLLGRERRYAVEEPGYQKIRQVYGSNGVDCVAVPLDGSGVNPAALEASGADVLHLSPSHHFPTGVITPIQRRQALYRWATARPGRWLIEDDYDSEFSFFSRPIPAMKAMDEAGRVIYMNTFTKTIAPSIRISYMVLPEALMERYRRELGFYACTVSSFEQYTLAAFIQEGYFERHINRMKKRYGELRRAMLALVQQPPLAQKLVISGENAGLHFLLRVQTELSDAALCARFAQAGIHVDSLSAYYAHPPAEDTHTLVVNYAGLRPEDAARCLTLLLG